MFMIMFVFVFSFSTYLPKRMWMQSLKIMQIIRSQEETLTASKNSVTHRFSFSHPSDSRLLLYWQTLCRVTDFCLPFSGSSLWMRWLLVFANISMLCWERSFSTNLNGHSTQTSWPTTQIHRCLRSMALLIYSDSLVQTPTQHHTAIYLNVCFNRRFKVSSHILGLFGQ